MELDRKEIWSVFEIFEVILFGILTFEIDGRGVFFF